MTTENANPEGTVTETPAADAIVSPVIAAAKEGLEASKVEAKTEETTTETKEQTTEEKAAAEATAKEAEEAKAKEGETPKGAPETYEEFQFPEGVEADAESVTEFKELAKAANLDQETAQKFAEMGPKIVTKMIDSQLKAMDQVVNGWADQTKADPELGGEKLTETLAVANKAMKAFATPELRTLLDKFDKGKNPNGTGLGNHPEFIRLMNRVGKALSEDKLVMGNEPGHTAKSAADKLYGTKNK